MKDTDRSLVADTLSVQGNQEMEHLQMELLKTRLELEETRKAYEQLKEESKKQKKLPQEKRYQDQKNGVTKEGQISVNGADSRLSEIRRARQTISNNQTCGWCKELENEVTSLNVVLQLRTSELCDWQRRCTAAEEGFKQLSSVHKENSALKFKIECLKQQLEKKSTTEETLSQENKTLLSSIQYESDQNRRLSLYNEELQWKLMQNISLEYKCSPLSKPMAQSSPVVQVDIKNQLQYSLQDSQLPLTPSTKENLLLQSSQVYGVVEKEDSISWIIDMTEQDKQYSISNCEVAQEPDLKKGKAVNISKTSPDRHVIPNTRLTRLEKKRLLR